ncbi:MAG: hypothetical protein JWO25_1444 [Alphaproteobacteria bacterium]|nr:hypothetical protein [Alphaproteobacteria bacterium]
MTGPTTILTAASPSRCAYAPSRDCVLVFGEAGGFILDMNSSLFALDEASAELLRAALDHGLDEAARRAAERSGCGSEAERRNLIVFLETLRGQGLLETEAAQRTPARLEQWLAGAAVAIACGRPGLARTRWLLRGARLSLRLWGWPRTFRSWRAAVERAGPSPGPDDVAAIERRVADAAASDLSGSACQERALCAWVLARLAGLDAQAVIGLSLHPLAGHCWCALGDRPIADAATRIAGFLPVLHYS